MNIPDNLEREIVDMILQEHQKQKRFGVLSKRITTKKLMVSKLFAYFVVLEVIAGFTISCKKVCLTAVLMNVHNFLEDLFILNAHYACFILYYVL